MHEAAAPLASQNLMLIDDMHFDAASNTPRRNPQVVEPIGTGLGQAVVAILETCLAVRIN